MTIQLYANNAKTTLSAPITATQTSITVAAGTGALFPSPTSGQSFQVTLVSASSSTVYEICTCTAVSSDTLTIVRGQEGTSGTPFTTGDIVANYDTALVMTSLVQSQQLQNQYYLFATASGTANALTATIPSVLTTIPNGMSIVVTSAYANTGASTLNLTLGSTATGVLPIVTGNNSALIGGEIPAAGYPITLSYSSTFNAWVITDGNISLNAYALINSQTFTGTPRVPNAPFNDNSTIIASTSWVQGQLANYAPIFSPTLTGVPATPTASTGTNTTQIASTAFVQNSLSSQKLGLGITGETWHDVTGSRSQGVTYTNSNSYPISVSICFGTNNDQNWSFYVNGIRLGFLAEHQDFNAAWMGGIVPPGGTYIFYGNYMSSWSELY
jgi:hypothetical protein